MLLTVHEVAVTLRVTPQHVYGIIAEGMLKSVRIGKSVRIDEAELRDFIAQGGRRRETSRRRSA